MTYMITKQITSFDQIDWTDVKNLIGKKVTELYCINNQITSFKHLPNSVTNLYCDKNRITSFQYLPNSITRLDCPNNQITSFQYIPNNVTDYIVIRIKLLVSNIFQMVLLY